MDCKTRQYSIQKILRAYLKKYEEGRRNKAPEEEMEIIHKGLTQGHAQLHSLLDEKEEEIAEAEKVRESLNIID